MAFFVPNPIPFEAGADLSAKDGFIVAIDTNGRIATAGAGVSCVGILYGNAPTSGTTGVGVSVAGPGSIYRCYVDGTTDIAPGDPIKSDANGNGVKASAGDKIVGFARGTATQASVVECIDVFVAPQELET
jgi:hypothetical protein